MPPARPSRPASRRPPRRPVYPLSRRDRPLFTFGVIADTHMRPEEGDDSSPWEVNLHANGRARYAVDRIMRADPEFVIHMGDVVHPFPSLSTFDPACEAAKAAFKGFTCPFYILPGNHDVGDKANPMAPADIVSEKGIAAYKRHFGRPHQSFDHKGVHFVLINCQVLNSGLPSEKPHNDWLKADLKANAGKRLWLFTHYPPYVTSPDEPGNYDNLDEPGRSWLLGLIAQYRIEAMFAGHVHNFFYQRHGKTEVYNLLATSFVRQDMAEIFRIAPEPRHQYGRDDAEKLGWCIVDVYPRAHVARVYRSYGRELGVGEKAPAEPKRLAQLHAKEAPRSPVGVHLRHPWAETVELPYNGPMDEFHRKAARNDYTLMALWEMGVRRLRVPFKDLIDADVRARVKALAEIGHEFTAFSFGLPDAAARAALQRSRRLIAAYEVVLDWKEAARQVKALAKFRDALGRPLLLSPIESSAGKKHKGSKFSHYVSSGFSRDRWPEIDAFLKVRGARQAADGFVFRIGPEESPWTEIPAIDAFAAARGTTAVATVRLAAENPAAYPVDDRAVANRVAEAFVAAAAMTSGGAFLDTLMDLDRGYFPRHGLYDRRLNRRLGSFVLGNLVSLLNREDGAVALGKIDGAAREFTLGGRPARLFLGGALSGRGTWIDLADGAIAETPPAAPTGPVVRLG